MIMVYPNSGTPSSLVLRPFTFLVWAEGEGKGLVTLEPMTFLHQYSGASIRLQYLDSAGFVCVFKTFTEYATFNNAQRHKNYIDDIM